MLVAVYHMPLYIDISPSGSITPSKCFLSRNLLPYPEYKSSGIQMVHHEQNEQSGSMACIHLSVRDESCHSSNIWTQQVKGTWLR